MASFVPMWSFAYRKEAVLLIVRVVDKYHHVSYEVMEHQLRSHLLIKSSSFNNLHMVLCKILHLPSDLEGNELI